jgi:molybdenum cofactor synthesis domain-containing protein
MKTAALLIIGNEILSGRTQDANLQYLAQKLTDKGIVLVETRVVRDIEDAIVEGINALRAQNDYVFTTGGIGPTHDDITIASIAKACGVGVGEHPDAYAALIHHYGSESEVTPARRRMALVPEGARLIANPVSGAPGVAIENIYILAGVPKIMQAMLDAVLPHLTGGPLILSETVVCSFAESKLADPLAEVQKLFSDVEIGSYPQYRMGEPMVAIVARGTDSARLKEVAQAVVTMAEKLGARPQWLPPVAV